MLNNKDNYISGDMSGGVNPKFLMEALMGEMRRMLKEEMEQVHARMDRVETALVEHP